MRPSRHALGLALLLFFLAFPVAADFVIELKDGRRYVLPFGPDDVARTWFTPETAARGAIRQLPAQSPIAAEAAPPPAAEPGPVLRVGPGGRFARPSEAAAVAADGAIIEIAPGTYRDLAFWPQSRLRIRGSGGMPVIDGGGSGIQGKAVWVVAGHEVTIENVAITGAVVPDHNGAGIRAEGGDLTLRRVRIYGNEIGILTSLDFAGTLLIEDSEFFDNQVRDPAFDGPPGHNIYVSGADRFILRGSWIHSPYSGHNVKTRARANEILYNRIEDGEGAGSYAIDIAEGAPTRIIGNVIRQGLRAQNHTLVSFAAEAPAPPGTALVVAFNTFENVLPSGTFLRIRGPAAAIVENNLFLGAGTLVEGEARLARNLRFGDVAAAELGADFVPEPRSAVVDAATIGSGGLIADRVHRFPLGTLPREIHGAGPDVGAYEARVP